MSYSQYDRFGRIVTPQDLQNKTLWCKKGEQIEQVFVRNYGKELGVSINPEKENNPYAPDLITNSGKLADLKAQNTPFFKVKKLYGIDPSYAVVFNRKDFERYEELYPEIEIFFWVEWHSVKFVMGEFVQEVEYVNGIWSIPFQQLRLVIEKSPEHFYHQRVSDNVGNAKSSFVLDLKNQLFKRLCFNDSR